VACVFCLDNLGVSFIKFMCLSLLELMMSSVICRVLFYWSSFIYH